MLSGKRNGFVCVAAALMLAACEPADDEGFELPPGGADILFINGAIYTVNPDQPWAEVVAINDGLITFVGHLSEKGTVIINDDLSITSVESRSEKKTPVIDLQSVIGRDTRVINLEGRMLLPGFIDSHTHIFMGSASAQSVNLSLADTPEKLATALETLRDTNPGNGLVYARGWQNHLFPPDGPRKEMLDEVFGERPVILGSVDGHSTWFSSRAAELAGVTSDTPDPEPGVSFFERDSETGVLLGTAREGAGGLVRSKLINFDRAYYRAALERWLPDAAASGLTSVYDAGARAPTEEDAYKTLADLEAEDKLTLRVFGSIGYRFGDDEPAARLVEMRKRFTGKYYQPYSVKLYADGVPEGHTAYLLTPYLDKPETPGEPMIKADKMVELVTAAFAQDVPVHIHAIGDGAIRIGLDAFEAAREATGNSETIGAIAHMDFVHADDIPRFAELGVVAQTSIQWATRDPSYDNIGAFVGLERMEAAYPVKSLIAAGAVQTFGADWPAAAYLSTYKPLNLIEVGHTRQLPGRADNPIRNEDERLPLEDLIAGMTLRAAYQVGAADMIGSIEVGKQADLIVLEKNLFEVEPHEIHNVSVMMTLMDGRVVHEQD